MKILVTAFEPFNGRDINPSQLILEISVERVAINLDSCRSSNGQKVTADNTGSGHKSRCFLYRRNLCLQSCDVYCFA